MDEARVSEAAADRLLEAIRRVAGRRAACARDPGRDFTRSRKVTLESLLTLLVTWGAGPAQEELAELFGWDGRCPSPAALTQQWAKLSDGAMPALLAELLEGAPARPHLGRYRLLAADGTGARLLPGTGGASCLVRNGHGEGFHSEAHLTCAYDLARGTFEDMVARGGAEKDEPAALCALVDRSAPPGGLTDLWLADRGFCSWNVIAHMLAAGARFCLRASGAWVSALLREDERPGELDLEVERCLTRLTGPAGRSRPGEPGLYRRAKRVDALPPGSREELWLKVRCVRVRLPGPDGDAGGGGRWLNLVTDLPADEFPPEALAGLYAARWGEETAFLHLKQVLKADMAPRTRDLARAVQELWGRLVLHDACALGTAGAPAPGRGSKHARATDRADAFRAFCAMVRDRVRRRSFDVEAYLRRRSHSERPGRPAPPRRDRPKTPPKSCWK